MDIVTIDFETYYSKEYTLSKMTTEAYVRDPRFEVIGVGVKVNDHPTDWYSGDNPGRFLKSLSYRDKAILCHNTVFDGAILSWHFGIEPKLWLDTLSMARPLHNVSVGGSLKALVSYYGLGAKGDEVINALGKRRADFSSEELSRYASYCVNDVELTYKLFHKMKARFTAEELRVIDIIMRMYTDPTIELDKELLHQHLEEVVNRKTNLVAEMGLACTEEEAKATLMSNEKFASFLKAIGVEPPTKISPRTSKVAYAFGKTDKAFTDLLEHEDPRVHNAVAARLGVKSTIEQSRTQSLLGVAERGKLPIMLNYYGAHTGRFSGGDKMNLQNLPRGGTLRKSLCAPKGKVLIACDSSQIEARMVAWVSDQSDLLQAFREGRDVYSEFASEVYGRKVTKADKLERFVGKTSILGLGYGMGATKFRDTLALGQGGVKVEIEASDAQRIVGLYRSKNHRIAAFWQRCGSVLIGMVSGKEGQVLPMKALLPYKDNSIVLPNRLPIQYPLLRRGETGDGFFYVSDARTFRKVAAAKLVGEGNEGLPWVRIYGGKVTENCLAAGTDVLTNRGWVRITDVQLADKLWDGCQWVSHDGLIYQGERVTTVLNGVRMTPDHKVLTDEGWRVASSCEGLHRAGFWLPDGSEVSGDKRQTVGLGIYMHMWERSEAGSHRRGEVRKTWWNTIMRMYARFAEYYAQYDWASSLRRMALHVRQMSSAVAPSMGKLWGARDHSGSRVARLYQVLGGHGADVRTRPNTGQARQQRWVWPEELPLGFVRSTGEEPQELATSGHSKGNYADGYFKIDTALPLETRSVYDIRNVGPNSRFVVRGTNGPFIVHNCVQALARIVVTNQMVAIAKRYKIILQVHDEVVCCVDESEAEEAKAFIMQCMSQPPAWAPDLPVACEADIGKNYGDAK